MLNKLERSENKEEVGSAWQVRRNAAGTLFNEGQFGAVARMMAENIEQTRRFHPDSIVLSARDCFPKASC